jgi:apolipoprotein N-acyltransferase
MAGGVLQFLGFVGFDRFYLEWIFLIPVLWAIRDQRPERAFLIGWVAGTVGSAGCAYWVIPMFREFTGVAWPFAALGLLAFAAAYGLVCATWAGVTRLITRSTGRHIAWVAPVVWTAVEKFCPVLFPSYLGASQYRLSLVTQIADVTGILGVTFLVVYFNATLYVLIAGYVAQRRIAWREGTIFVAVLAAVLAYGAVRIRTLDRQAAGAGKLTVGLIQTNRGSGEKHRNPEHLLREHREMSRELAATVPLDLLVWPEDAGRVILTSREGELSPGVLGDLKTPTLFGAILQQGERETLRSYNTAVLADDRGRILGTYEKRVLVPFGDYIPWGETFPWLYSWSPYSSGFRRGESAEPLRLGTHLLSVSICYEDMFPGEVRLLMQGGRDRRIPDVMINLTNDSWYGKTNEPLQHLVLASFRAIEQRRSLVRATNTGISAFVDPVGRLARCSGVWTKETLVERIPLLQGRTLYRMMGDWLGWACGVIALCGMARAIRKARHQGDAAR